MNNPVQILTAPVATISQPRAIQQGFVPERVVQLIRDIQALGLSGTLMIEMRDGVPQKASLKADAEKLLTKIKSCG